MIKHFPNEATCDPQIIRRWWARWPDANIGISTSRFRETEALVVVDIDNKKDKDGDSQLLRLELSGWEFPTTYTVTTPTGGRHLFYRVSQAVRQGANVLGSGLDIRSRGGYVVGCGSVVAQGTYVVASDAPLAPAPGWLVAQCGASDKAKRDEASSTPIGGIDQTRACKRAVEYLKTAKPAVEGAGGDARTVQTAMHLKDLGLPENISSDLMLEHFNPRCVPPWEPAELRTKIRNAYKYGSEPPGSAAPEVQFGSVEIPSDGTLHPLKQLANQYTVALISGGVRILRHATDATGRESIEHLNVADFRHWLRPQVMQIGNRTRQLSDLFLEAPDRPEIDRIVFAPGEPPGPRTLNLWRGFTVRPAESSNHPAVRAWLEHTERNVCQGDQKLFAWLLNWCAHMIQKPGEKPLVAVVLIGGKGVGKNAWIETLGHLLGVHFLVTANRRYLTGHFNSHLERCLLLGLDEAFWSGDKAIEGILKDLITGQEHVIEHKGKEPYTVANRTRVIILSNSEWVVPASHDERRFAVFTVGEGRKQDRKFFGAMHAGMQAGGYEALLRYLLNFDLDFHGVDVNVAPNTTGLQVQKDRSLEPLPEWWLACLLDGAIQGTCDEGWPSEMSCDAFRNAFRRHCQDRNILGRVASDDSIGRSLKAFAPGIRKRRLSQEGRPRGYVLPPLDQARGEWDVYLPGRKWTNDDEL